VHQKRVVAGKTGCPEIRSPVEKTWPLGAGFLSDEKIP